VPISGINRAFGIDDDILIRHSGKNLQEVFVEPKQIIVTERTGQPQEPQVVVAKLGQGSWLNLLRRAKSYGEHISGYLIVYI